MEQKIMSVLRKMQEHLHEDQLRELKTVLHMVFADCELVQKTELRVVDRSWVDDLEDYLMSKELEGKSAETVKRYRYELNRLLSYTNKAVANINDADISEYMRAYKRIRKISNQTLENVRAVFSSFFAWLRDRDRIRKNHIYIFFMVLLQMEMLNWIYMMYQQIYIILKVFRMHGDIKE